MPDQHALLSASSSARWIACPPSALAAAAYPEQDTAYTAEGTLAHTVAEACAKGLKVSPSERDGITPEMITHGQAYADYISELIHDPGDATVLLEQRVDFSDWVPGGFGTADCAILEGDAVKIVEYKYGVGVPVSAVGNPQMRLYALGAYSLLADLYPINRIEMHIFQPRIDNISSDEISVEDLIDWASLVVKPSAVLAIIGKGDYTTGRHCRFCPHAGRCRMLAEECTEVVKAAGTEGRIEILSPKEISRILARESMVTAWMKKVHEQALSDMLAGKEIPGYKVVEGKLGNRKWIDEIAAVEALEAAGITRDEFLETKLMSPSALEKALGKKRAGAVIAENTDRAHGAPTIAPESDKREKYDALAVAQEDFK